MNKTASLNRRRFIKTLGATAVSVSIVPAHVLGGRGYKAPSDKLNIAGIGVGGMGKNYLYNALSENIVALCDVDEARYDGVYERFAQKLTPDELAALKKNMKHYQDFREMLDKEKNIDAVMIGTPDHTHAVTAMECIKRNKHVYLAKPMTRTISECRTIMSEAKKQKIVTQVSIQKDASEDHRLISEWIRDGAIGDVREVHIWSNRPIWPQGIQRPKEIPSVPPTLDWNLWIGPAPFRPYHPAYHPFDWHGWYDFGTGALGDMGSHHFAPVFKALKLTAPTDIQASSTPLFPETYPKASIVHYDFPARENMPPVRLTWYDGGLTPRIPDVLEAGRKMGNRSGGELYIGDKGMLLSGCAGRSPRLIPETAMKGYTKPEKTIPRSPGHYVEWLNACKGGDPANCDFDFAGPITDVILLGCIAVRHAGERLSWDTENARITNNEEANKLIEEPYHNGWSL